MIDMQPGREYVAAFRGTAQGEWLICPDGVNLHMWLDKAAALVPVADGPQPGDRVEHEGYEWIVAGRRKQHVLLTRVSLAASIEAARAETSAVRILARAVYLPEPQPDPLPAWLRDIGEATHAVVLVDERSTVTWNGSDWFGAWTITPPERIEEWARAGRLRIVSRNGEPYTGEA